MVQLKGNLIPHMPKDITVTGNDAGSSPPSSVLCYSTLVHVRIYIDCRVFNAVTYQPALYLLVAVSINCIVMPCLEFDTLS